jgi:hypothetical protein
MVSLALSPFSALTSASETSGYEDISAKPEHIRMSFTSDPLTSITISWDTSIPADSVVEYGLTEEYTWSAIGGSSWFFGFTHVVQLSGLEPGTNYHYRCGSEMGWSAELHVPNPRPP